MLVHTHHHSSPGGTPPVIPVSCHPGSPAPARTLPAPAAMLRRCDLKLALRAAYRYGTGGEKVDVIALDLGVNRGKAARMLSTAYPDSVGAVHLERLRVRNPIVAAKLGVANVRAA